MPRPAAYLGLHAAYYRRLGARIRAARRLADMSQADIARLTGMPRTAMTLIETGRQTLRVHELAQIALVLDVDFKWLLMSNGD